MNRKKLLRLIAQGKTANIGFADLLDLAEGFGFKPDGIAGSHRVLKHDGLRTLLNLQPVAGQAKPYQVRQLMRLVEKHHLPLED